MTRRIVDAHTHIFPPDMIARREEYLPRDAWFRLCYENPNLILASAADLINSMDAADIQTSLACGFPWSDPGLCREHNDWMAEISRTHAGRIAFLAIVAPHLPGAAAEAERAFNLGAAGIGELNADAQGFALTAPDTVARLMAVCHERGKPVMLHATEPIGHVYPGKGTATPERLVTWLAAFPEQPVVLAHWGGGLPFFELMPEVRAVTHSVAYDSAATTYLYSHSIFQHVISLVGSERVLFGSDYPILRQDRLVRRVATQISDSESLSMIYADNADRIYGLSQPGKGRT